MWSYFSLTKRPHMWAFAFVGKLVYYSIFLYSADFLVYLFEVLKCIVMKQNK